ncbi:hypothetical protein PLESTB_000156700 [Pleodorina starrii]|uniref:Pan3 C-terminal knob domain-containing protein n=1 Tax=Pleodorina starrii TaxID=330485 RepID=A0A9W6BBT3_9CHLO|nr:hypothetical protein PLESTM_000455200 [Pleodorina starrii]GLC48863.1 hypothetical protein PLESTB_000156700 [Pleodorina starrii]
MPGPGQENVTNSLSGKVNAAPFVPTGSPQPKTPGASGGFPESAVKAQPFVPGKGGSQGNSHGGLGAQGGPGKGASTKLAANAAAFVPKQPDGSAGKGTRGPSAADAGAGSEGPASASGHAAAGGRGSGASTVGAASPSAATAAPAAGRGAAARGGRGGAASAGATPPPAGQFQPGRMGGGLQGRGGGRAGPLPGLASSSPAGSSPGPMQGRGGGGRGGGGRGGAGAGGYMAGGVMHHPAAGPMMGGGFGAHVGHMGPISIASYGAGGGSHLPSYRPRDLYLAGPGRAYVGLHFAEEGLKQQLQHRSYMITAQWHDETSDDPVGASAFRLGPYHTLYPLEEGAMGPAAAATGAGAGVQVGPGEMPSVALGLRTSLVKGVSSVDGSAAALRRIDPKQVIPTAELLSRTRETVEQWSPLANHPNLVGLRAAFLASDSLVQPQPPGQQPAGDASALVFAHDFHPGAVSLAAAHLVPQMNAAGLVSAPQPPPEEVVWSYAVQITSALRAAHGCGLLLRPACLHPSKVLLTGFGRLRIGSVGVLDALMGGEQPGPDELQMLMRQDISAMGSLLLTICCAGTGPAPSLDLVAANYSPELVRLLGALLAAAEGGPLGSWRGLVAALADRAFTELDSTGVSLDHMVGELSKEVENGRMLRLLAKLNFVTERPSDSAGGQDNGDSAWSETGDRYLLKLFRDFVFHAAALETGAPLLDWGLLVEALNKVDAGVHEEILLLGRDGQSMLVVTYADIKRCLENAFAELKSAANSAAGNLSARGVQPGRGGPMMRM